MKITRFRWRSRSTAGGLGIAASALGVVLGLSACSPPPINHGFQMHINLHDSTGAGDVHLTVNSNVTVDSCGNVTASTASTSQNTYGWLNTFGDIVKANPVWAAGNSASNIGPCVRGWVNSTQYSVTAVWDVKLGYTIGNVGIAGDKGQCVATWPLIITSGGGAVDSTIVVNLAKVRTQCHNGFYLSYST